MWYHYKTYVWNVSLLPPSTFLFNHLSVCSSLPTWFPARCVFGVPPVQREAEGLCRLQREDPGPLHAAGVGQVLARGLPEVCLLWLPPGPGGLHPLHPGEPHPLPQGLPEVTRTPLAGGSGLKEGKTCCSQVQSLQYIDSVKLDTAQGWKGRLTVDPLGIQVKGNSLIMLVTVARASHLQAGRNWIKKVCRFVTHMRTDVDMRAVFSIKNLPNTIMHVPLQDETTAFSSFQMENTATV